MVSGLGFMMKQRQRSLVAACLIGMGCGPLPRDESLRLPTGDGSTPAESVAIDAELELGAACPSSLESCPPNPTSACRVSCQPAGNGCAEVWELHHVATAPPGFTGYWQAIDPQGEHGHFSWVLNDDDDDYDHPERFTWSAAGGVVSLSAAIGHQPFFDLHELSDDASVALGTIGLDHVFWSREHGIEPLPLQNPALARDGSLVAGQVGRRGARWVRSEGTQRVFEFDSDRYSARAEGGTALFMDARRVVYSPAEGEPSIIEAPADASPESTFRLVTLSADGSSFAAVVGDGRSVRLYRWAQGALAPVELALRDGESAMLLGVMMSADGSVIVATVGPSFQTQRLIRWTAETGSQVLSEDPTLYVSYLSPAGDVILGSAELPDESDVGLRWSVEEGMRETPPLYAPERSALDGDVLVGMSAEGPIVHKYGRVSSETLPIEHLRGRLPSRWSTLQLGRISPDARVLAGTARLEPEGPGRRYTLEELLELDARGELPYPERPELLWLARASEVCPAGP